MRRLVEMVNIAILTILKNEKAAKVPPLIRLLIYWPTCHERIN